MNKILLIEGSWEVCDIIITCRMFKQNGHWIFENRDEIKSRIFNPACRPYWTSTENIRRLKNGELITTNRIYRAN